MRWPEAILWMVVILGVTSCTAVGTWSDAQVRLAKAKATDCASATPHKGS